MSALALSTLLPVALREIGDAGQINSVDARHLWKSLDIRKPFADWWRQQVESLGLVEGVDFVLLHLQVKQSGRGGHNRQDYAATTDAAKGIAMASRTEAGKRVRRYFIECERIALQAPQEGEDALILRAVTLLQGRVEVAEERAELAEAQIETDRPKVAYAEDMALAPGMVATFRALKLAGLSEKLNPAFWAALDGPGGYFHNRPDEERHWRPELVNQGLGDNDFQTRYGGDRSGSKAVYLVPKWTAKGVQHLRAWTLARRRQGVIT